ncbi:MAG: TraR/DksA C4-type zinc finger protein [Pseudomonadota bacterium]
MPSSAEIEIYRTRLKADLAALDGEDTLGAESQEPVTLDQQSVGRLSRMDALQQQAMAQATQRRRTTQRSRIIAALARIGAGEYGDCTACGDDIAKARLNHDPALPLCLSCALG